MFGRWLLQNVIKNAFHVSCKCFLQKCYKTTNIICFILYFLSFISLHKILHVDLGIWDNFVVAVIDSDFVGETSVVSRSACLKWFTSLLTWAASCLRNKKGNAKDWLQILQICFDIPPSGDRLWMEAIWYKRWFFWTKVLLHCWQTCWRSLRWVK